MERLSAASRIIRVSFDTVRWAIAERHAAGAIGHQHPVFRPGHHDIVERDVLRQLCRVDALLVARPDQVMELMPVIATTGTLSICASYRPLRT
jgi:hypothetical protein